jgi:hypothetical protein
MPLAFMKNGMSNRRIAGLLFLEAAVIFAGITGSFWMEEWRQERDDQETYQHLLEEIYYNTTIAEAELPGEIAGNNLALRDALELTVLDSSELTDSDLYIRLDHIFSGVAPLFSNAGYVRLSNTSLSIPFDETLLTLDNTYETFARLEAGFNALDGQINELRARHWRNAGMISCTGAASNDGTVILMDRPYMAEIRSLIYPEGDCITQEENAARARDLLAQPDFRNAVRQVIDLRQGVAWLLGRYQELLGDLQAAIEARLPGISLPVTSMELISWPRVTTAETERQTPMRRTGTHTWEVTANLTDGFVKFRANEDWSINWGAPFPYMIDAPGFLWNSDRVKIEDVFPSGTAHFKGMNLPVFGGRYRVTFNSQTGEYAFAEEEES